MDVTSSLLNLLPSGRRSIGINQLIDKLETYLPPEQVERVQSRLRVRARPTRARTAARASPTSRIRSRSPTCSPTCTSTRRR